MLTGNNVIKKCFCDDKKPYIFISYAHRDSRAVLGIIDRLVKSGYNVWWDEGIDPGTEWDENIAAHVMDCSYFVAFISKNYIDSKNCKDELNYSRDLDNNQLLVYLENVELPRGMAMRMNRIQSIFWCNYKNPEDAFDKLFAAKGIEVAMLPKEAPAGQSTAGVQTTQAMAAPAGSNTPPAPSFNQGMNPGAAPGFNTAANPAYNQATPAFNQGINPTYTRDLVLSVVLIGFTLFYGLIPLFLTLGANTCWKNSDREGYQKKSKAARIALIIGFVIVISEIIVLIYQGATKG
ncbi:MAG: toll/interleukin-1 receptor domain-containing protein [Lachnospiraceae bacterium]|nr:toll/interleukin-1 receptor domain-containing protein [Lachnospiraceae bacterium]